ncbi:heavy metal-associated isoprenylated plant protein 35-like [Salvia hispanica]|uniref:heavy metal-associated isoprenylated plant protein 35-like n=1 Tax=Salvia hispanica TaxID=49212 RepID=UPI00200968EB|nr:heavy metal-associated isoprenylated plant protein 35-like [Salvia hispanica]
MAEEPINHLKTTIIKASIHCQGCKRKVHKILSQIQGVEHVDIDAQQHKVTVKGNVDADALIRKLIKSGKNAQLWPQEEIIPTIGNKKEMKTEEKNDAVEAPPASGNKGKTTETAGDGGGGDVKKASAGADVKRSEDEESCSAAPEKSDGVASAKKKKKKKRVQIDGGLENPVPASNESPTPTPCHDQFPPPVCAVSYNTAYPSSSYTASYYTAPPPHAHAYMHQMEPPPLDSEMNQRQPLDSFEMFSDENPNGCFIM